MAKEIPKYYYGEAMRELDSDPKLNLLAKCIAQEGSTDAGRAKYISKRAKKLFYKAEREKKEAEEEQKRQQAVKEREREERLKEELEKRLALSKNAQIGWEEMERQASLIERSSQDTSFRPDITNYLQGKFREDGRKP